MGTTFEITETFNEPFERVCENLFSNASREKKWYETTEWNAVYTDDLVLADDSRVWQVLGYTSAFRGIVTTRDYDKAHYAHFLVKVTELSTVGTEVYAFLTSPYDYYPSGPNNERQRLVKIADKLLEFCAVPNAERDTGLAGWIRTRFAQGREKRKIGDGL